MTPTRPLQEESPTLQKRSILLSRLSVVLFSITAIYIFLDWLLDVHVQAFLYAGAILLSIVTFILNKIGRTRLAKAIGLTVFNGIIFIVASSEPPETGIHLHFVAAGSVALMLYGYEEWPMSVGFALLSLVLYLLVYMVDFSIIEERVFQPQATKIFFIINATVSASISVYSFLLFSRINSDVENSLLAKEKLLREQNERLEKTNKELDRFVYSVSHDLRAPLSSISGLIQLAEKTSDPKESQEYFDFMKDRINRLEEFIRDIINFSRNARAEMRQEHVNVKMLVHEIFDTLKFVGGAERIVLEDQLPSPFIITTDRMRLQIVLFNLISNAIQYHNPHQPHPHIRVSGTQDQEGIQLHIDDNGIGIDATHQARIFDMFYRGTQQSKGSGLGLYIVRETAEKIGATISVKSKLGEFTQFTLAFPSR